MNITLSGSLAYDYLMTTSSSFYDGLHQKDLKKINISVLNTSYKKLYGGTAGNIAYHLHILKIQPKIVTSLGFDAAEYLERLSDWHIDTRFIHLSSLPTPNAHIITDQEGNQINAFTPGALTEAHLADIISASGDIVCLSPNGDKQSMRLQHRRIEKTDAKIIFDPGQMLFTWNPEELLEDLESTYLLILNHHEFHTLLRKIQETEETFFERKLHTIITHGSRGSKYYFQKTCLEIPAVNPKKIVEPTGCGDAFRAGVLWSISQNQSFEIGMKVGATLASYTLESQGGQPEHISFDALKERFERTFLERFPL